MQILITTNLKDGESLSTNKRNTLNPKVYEQRYSNFLLIAVKCPIINKKDLDHAAIEEDGKARRMEIISKFNY